MFRRILPVLFVLALTGCEAKIQQNLDERQANEIVTSLLERGFQPKKELEPGKKPTWSIVVASDQSDDATRVLVELGLPREKQPTGADLIKPGIVPSAAEEFALKNLGLQGDIARTLEAVDGVLAARVHLAISPPPRVGQLPGPSKAAAFLRVRAGKADWMERNHDALKQLIAGSVEGLSPENVTLVFNETQPTVPVLSTQKPAGSGLRIVTAILALLLSATSAGVIYLLITGRHPAPRTSAKAPSPTQPATSRKAA